MDTSISKIILIPPCRCLRTCHGIDNCVATRHEGRKANEGKILPGLQNLFWTSPTARSGPLAEGESSSRQARARPRGGSGGDSVRPPPEIFFDFGPKKGHFP